MRLGLIPFTVALASAAPALFNSSTDSNWKNWAALRGTAQVDTAVKREGRASLRVEAAGASDAMVRSAWITLRPGAHYEITGWARTESVEASDSGRSPVVVGATLSMASMPFDVHSESLAGTRDWTRLRLRFTAARTQDAVLLRVAEGGTFRGRVWFEGVSIEEIGADSFSPAPETVRAFGPAYRYPSAGWIYLHIEGKPYERGYQHGYLMPKEIERYLERCASQIDPKAREAAWSWGRTSADALFLRGFDDEIREEMKGIADGAAAAGAKWHGRKVDLMDIVTANTIVELGDLRAALHVTKTGLEGIGFVMPGYGEKKGEVAPNERCSAFAATGKATRDGHMIVAHTTFWALTLAEQTNVMLDVKPERGHRLLMQAYPGAIESGTDWYQNDAGIVLTETTIRQSPFNRDGTPVAFRARKAIQYSDSIDDVVRHLSERNNGLYTNEWIIGDGKTDEIAMFELGTYKTKLWRSSKNEWFGGTDGFYWGCNNAKDIDVRMEVLSDSKGRPEDLTFQPSVRDVKWRELYRRHVGSIDEQFAFLAFRTSPIVSASAMDAKVATAEMARNQMVWAAIGKPNQRERLAQEWDRNGINDGLYPSGYRLFAAQTAAPAAAPAKASQPGAKEEKVDADRLWSGWISPASDGDVWLSGGAAAYFRILSDAHPNRVLDAFRVAARSYMIAADTPLSKIRLSFDSDQPNRLATAKGALLLDALRNELGDDRFFGCMRAFFDAHTTQRVSSAEFRQQAEKAAGKPLASFFDAWLDGKGIPGDKGGVSYLANEIGSRFGSLLIVYGTMADAGANRYAAEQFRLHDYFEHSPAIRKDFEVTDEDLRTHDVVFIGNPDSNQALAQVAARIGLKYAQGVFAAGGKEHSSEYDALIHASANPFDPRRMVLVIAGNSALETVRAAKAELPARPFAVLTQGAAE